MTHSRPADARGSTEANRAVVENFLTTFASGDTDEMAKHLSDDATYWILGTKHGLGTEIPKREFVEMHRSGADAYVDRRLNIIPTGWTVQGERVAVEADGSGTLQNGRSYDNRYHYLFVVREGKIAAVREYNDTDYMFSVLIAP